MHKRSIELVSTLGLILTGIVWGSTFFIVKRCITEVDPIALSGYRYLISAIIIFFGLIVFKKNPFANWRHGLILGVILLLSYLGQVVGLKYIPASSSAFITGLFIVLVPLLNFIFWREKLSIFSGIAIITALIGLWIVTGGIGDFEFGEFLTLAGSVFYALYVLYVDKMMKNEVNPWVIMFQQFLVTGIASFILAFVLHTPLTLGSMANFYAILYLAIFASILAFGIQLTAQKYLPPVKVSLLLSLEPVFGAVFAWTLGGETFSEHQAIGGLFILSAIIFSELQILKFPKKGKAS